MKFSVQLQQFKRVYPSVVAIFALLLLFKFFFYDTMIALGEPLFQLQGSIGSLFNLLTYLTLTILFFYEIFSIIYEKEKVKPTIKHFTLIINLFLIWLLAHFTFRYNEIFKIISLHLVIITITIFFLTVMKNKMDELQRGFIVFIFVTFFFQCVSALLQTFTTIIPNDNITAIAEFLLNRSFLFATFSSIFLLYDALGLIKKEEVDAFHIILAVLLTTLYIFFIFFIVTRSEITDTLFFVSPPNAFEKIARFTQLGIYIFYLTLFMNAIHERPTVSIAIIFILASSGRESAFTLLLIPATFFILKNNFQLRENNTF